MPWLFLDGRWEPAGRRCGVIPLLTRRATSESQRLPAGSWNRLRLHRPTRRSMPVAARGGLRGGAWRRRWHVARRRRRQGEIGRWKKRGTRRGELPGEPRGRAAGGRKVDLLCECAGGQRGRGTIACGGIGGGCDRGGAGRLRVAGQQRGDAVREFGLMGKLRGAFQPEKNVERGGLWGVRAEPCGDQQPEGPARGGGGGDALHEMAGVAGAMPRPDVRRASRSRTGRSRGRARESSGGQTRGDGETSR